MIIIECMVSEILSVTDRIFCHFGLFFAPLPHWPIWKNEKNAWRHHHFTLVYQKSWQHATLVLWDRCNFHFSFWATFCPFTLLTARKIKIKKKKKKKIPGDIIILHMCTKNYDHIMCGSWDMVCNERMDRQTDKKKWHKVVAPPKKLTYSWR